MIKYPLLARDLLKYDEEEGGGGGGGNLFTAMHTFNINSEI